MRTTRRSPLAVLLLVLALLGAACGDSGDDQEAGSGSGGGTAKGRIVVGSTNFTEQLIVANLYAKVLEHAGYEVTLRANLGSREVVQPALQSGEIDLLPEYVGTLLEFLEAGSATSDLDESVDKLRELLKPMNLTALDPAPAEDANAFVVTRRTATEKRLARVSDLAPVAGGLVLGGPPECPTRPLCLIGLEREYGVRFREFKPLDSGGPITKGALEKGEIDVAVLFSSDLGSRDFVALEDDKGLQPAENVIPVVRTEKVTPELRQPLDELSARLTTDELSEMNQRVGVDKEDPSDVAEKWLRDNGLPG